MNWNLSNFVAPLFLAVSAVAQNCAHTEAVQVREPNPVRYGAVVSCSGLNLVIDGIALQVNTGCPLFVEIYPDTYSSTKLTTADTEAVLDQHQSITTHFFRCNVSYLIFIPISSTCEWKSTTLRPGRDLKQTVACNDLVAG